MLPPSGEQIVLAHDELTAVITEVGATLRSFRVGSEPVVWEGPLDDIDSGGRGQVLAPWPNRLEDGCYRFGERTGRAAIDEPERNNAIHGLVRWMAWDINEHTETSAKLTCVVHPQPAYPFRVRLELDYELGVGGLKATCTATNTGSETAPFGIGFHPYLLASRGGIDEAEINLSSKRRLLVDGRQLPVGDESVSGTGFDLAGRALKGLRLDDCFTELQLADDGAWHAYLHTDDRRAEIWADGAFGYVMCYTGDSLAEKDRRKAIAVEPMTCPPNAFRSGTRVIELAPEERWQASWGIAATFTGRGDAPAGNPAELGA